jgi:hypothetical protein
MRLIAISAAFLFCMACSASPTPPATQKQVDYKAITQPLLLPLGALIVAVRGNTPTTDYWLGQFNKSADSTLQAIDGDSSDTATRLRTGIANVRARPTDLQTLEDTRSMLLGIT